MSRRDSLDGDTFSNLGEPYVFPNIEVESGHLHPAQARDLAALLVQAADMADQS